MSDWGINDPIATPSPALSARMRVTVAPGAPKEGDWGADDPIAKPGATFAGRFSAIEPQQELQPEAKQAGMLSRLLTGFENQGAAASQGTTPDIAAHAPNLVSDQTTIDEEGNILYRDPATNKLVPTDTNKQVAIRDPNDGKVRVYARTENTDEGRLSAAGRILGTGMAAGPVTARANAPRVIPQAKDILPTSKPYYQTFDRLAQDTHVPARETVGRVEKAIEAAHQPEHLQNVGEVYQTVRGISGRQPQAPSALQQLEAEMNWRPIPPPAEEFVPLSRLRETKENLNASSMAGDTRTRAAAGAAKAEIRNVIAEASPEAGHALSTADKIHGIGKAAQDFERRLEHAAINTGKAGYGGNTENHIRQAIAPILKMHEDGKKTGYVAEEIAALRRLNDGSTARNFARTVSQASPAKGSIATGLGYMTLGVSSTIGIAAQAILNRLTKADIARFQELLAKRSPAYTQAVDNAINRVSKAQLEFVKKPNSATLAALVGSTRTLASGFKKDGITFSSADIIKALQGPVRSRSEYE